MNLTKIFKATAAALAVFCFASCGEKNTYVAPPPPQVDAQPPLERDITVYREFQGRTEAFARYEVRTRVTGFLKSIDFKDGLYVKVGDPLFTIDPIQFQAAVDSAEGELAKAKAQHQLAKTNFEKREQASKSGAVSKIDVAAAKAEMEVAEAEIGISEAALTNAKEELGYTKLYSKINGRVSRRLVDVGNIVSGTEGTLLATVVQDDPIYVSFDVSERDILDNLSGRPSADRAGVKEELLALELKLTKADGTPYGTAGQFHSLDNEVDPGTGTIEVTTLFENDESALAAGLSVRVGIPVNLEGATIIPRSVLQRDVGGDYVLVVGEGNKVERRNVSLTEYTLGELIVIDKGLAGSDKVIVSNLQRVRPGAEVAPTDIPAPSIEAAEPAPAPAPDTPPAPAPETPAPEPEPAGDGQG